MLTGLCQTHLRLKTLVHSRMIKSRGSDDHLHSDVILRKISEYDIFRHYIPSFKALNTKFSSELREDSKPTAAVYVWKGTLYYKDHGRPDHSFKCINYVQAKFNCNWITALRIIDMDFNLGLSSSTYDDLRDKVPAVRHGKIDLSENSVLLRKKSRPWTQEDADFWKQFYISKEILVKFGVEPISYYWINTLRIFCETITYSYTFGNRYKIYAPLSEKGKWFSTTTAKDIQGWKQLPEKGETVILTSSLKDIMTLKAIGFDSVALQTEMQIPSEDLISQLRERFDEILVFYDNDFSNENNPGQLMAHKICDKYNLINICIPSKYESKDPSDLVKHVGQLILKQIIDEQRKVK